MRELVTINRQMTALRCRWLQYDEPGFNIMSQFNDVK